ncbi:MAG: cell division protein FtsQ [Bacteroidaceae bacterium]|nr:cell division protein FtsQ [Bacteroidaceae bacterium]
MKFTWKKTFLVISAVALVAYLIFAVTVLNRPDENKKCTGVELSISDETEDGFLNVNEIKQILKKNDIYPLGKQINEIDSREIENVLKKSPFVETAECYKTPGGHVCIELTQRMPVIRIKSVNGEDYYIDDQGGIMPNVKYISDIAIATGFISKRYSKTYLTNIGKYLLEDKFWQQCIEQINVLRDGSIEMIPRIGEHVVYLGRPTYIQQKLERLRKFYKYGLNQVGWNKYSYISLEFENQIICKKRQNI